jgi:SAM-dependent methyltransferase
MTERAGAAPDVRHPLFARGFALFSRVMERELGEHRRELLAGLRGRVLEVGAGNGMNFPHYPPTVGEVVALEPEPYLRARAERAARRAPVPVAVRPGVADPLALADGEFDAAVACLVLCTVPEPRRALAELRRVLVPGGELRFLEHVRAEGAGKARLQAGADGSGLWPRLVGGCHCARDTVGAIRAEGFEVVDLRAFDLGASWALTNPHVLGRAQAPLDAAKAPSTRP